MTETPARDRVEPVDIQQEMQRSYIDYAMSVIVGRALPEVRDGLKPVHRRVLYAMYDQGFRPDRSYVKCARVVGEVMGNYHPHGDSAIYDALVRLAQPWSMRYPLIDGQGNFGSPGNDPAAAMRYCVTGDALVRTADGTVTLDELAFGMAPNSERELGLKVLDRNGDPVMASTVFHSGVHPTKRLTTTGGYSLTGTGNHPVLCLVSVLGVPTLLWKLLEEITPGDRVLLQCQPREEVDVPSTGDADAALLAATTVLEDESADKRVPGFVWASTTGTRRLFLRALFEGDGSSSLLPRSTIQISYSTRSDRLARQVQQLLLEFGVVSSLCRYDNDELEVVVTNRRNARLFAAHVGFLGRKQAELDAELAQVPAMSTAMSADHVSDDDVPFVADFLRAAQSLSRGVSATTTAHSALIEARITNVEALAVVAPLVDGRFHYAEVASVVEAGEAPVFSLKVETEGHDFLTNGFVSHNTEARLTPLAMEMLANIDEETVDFQPNYDGKNQEPLVLPGRIPNLLINGSSGIAVGMATNMPPHNLREVAAAVFWMLEHPDAQPEEALTACMERVLGPDFPTHGLIVGRDGIEDAYRTGRGSVRMRAVVTVEEDAKGRVQLVVTELPYQVNPDNLAESIAEAVKDGRLQGISEIADESSDRVGRRLVVTLRRDAVAKVVLNNLYKHTQLQTTFGCNMLSIVDGVPRTLRLDELVRHYVHHQIEVIQRRTRYRLRKAEERAHLLRGYAKALDQLDAVIALIRASESSEAARGGLMELLDVDEIQATAILDLQLRRLAALERQRIIDELAEIEARIAELQAILDSPERQRQIIHDELAEIVEKYGDERRSKFVAHDGDVSMEDLIAEEEVVITITRTGYAKRTKSDLYRSQRRGGKGVMGAALKQDDLVQHFFVGSTHNWILFFTNKGRVYRAKAYELPEANRTARGAHVANILAFQPDEKIAQVIQIKDYQVAPYLVLATANGQAKKTRLTDFDSPRSGGVIAINLRDGDELVGAALIDPEQDLLLVSRKAMSIRFRADDEQLRPMGRATEGVRGISLADDDRLLSMIVVEEGVDVLVATEGGYAKRTGIEHYPAQGRGGKGVFTADPRARKGALVGALSVVLGDELYAITSSGGVIRTPVSGVRHNKDRATMGVKLMNLPEDASIVAIARTTDNDEPDALG